jgi:hypothetical protein
MRLADRAKHAVVPMMRRLGWLWLTWLGIRMTDQDGIHGRGIGKSAP